MDDLKTAQATPLVTSIFWSGLETAERERRERGATRLRELYSKMPFYANAAKLDGNEYWASFYDSRVNW